MSIAVENTTCGCGKVVYVSRREALKQAKRAAGFRNPTKGQLRPYRCEKGFWHLTSRPVVPKSRRIQLADDREQAKAQRKAVKQRRSVQQLRVVSVPVSRAPKVAKLPEHRTTCPCCHRVWINSDFSPVGRRCPGLGGRCTHVFTELDPRDRRQFRWELAQEDAA